MKNIQRDTEAPEWAFKFFSELFLGSHHIPGRGHGIKNFGMGYCINYHPGNLSTFDLDGLTRLVFMAHRDCIRAEICPSGPGMVKIAIWKREKREGRMYERHPTIEQALEQFNK
jgi:hypothetical protein